MYQWPGPGHSLFGSLGRPRLGNDLDWDDAELMERGGWRGEELSGGERLGGVRQS